MEISRTAWRSRNFHKLERKYAVRRKPRTRNLHLPPAHIHIILRLCLIPPPAHPYPSPPSPRSPLTFTIIIHPPLTLLLHLHAVDISLLDPRQTPQIQRPLPLL